MTQRTASKYKKELDVCLDRSQKKRQSSIRLDLESVSKEVMKEFKTSEKKRKQLLHFLEKSVESTKKREFRVYVEPEYPRIVRKNTAHFDLLESAQNLPTVAMTKHMERDIIKRLNAKRLEIAFPETFQNVLKEVKDNYRDVTHQEGVNYRVRPLSGDDPHPKITSLKLLGKTQNYIEYLRTRDLLSVCLFNVYPLHRKVFRYCINEVPERLLEYAKVKHSSTFEQFLTALHEQLHQSHSLIQHFYVKIVKLCEHDRTQIPKGYKKKYWSTVSALLSEHISRSIRNTIVYVVKQIIHMKDVPYLIVRLIYSSGFKLFPSELDALIYIGNLIQSIKNTGEQLETIESVILNYKRKTYLKIYINDEYIEEIEMTLKRNIAIPLAPIYEHIESLTRKFEPIIKEQEIFEENLANDMSFEEGFEKINYFRTFVVEVLIVLDNEFFGFIKLSQIECKDELQKVTENLIDTIAYKLVMQHEWENRDICDTFEMLAMRAKQIPKTTEELMEMGKFLT